MLNRFRFTGTNGTRLWLLIMNAQGVSKIGNSISEVGSLCTQNIKQSFCKRGFENIRKVNREYLFFSKYIY